MFFNVLTGVKTWPYPTVTTCPPASMYGKSTVLFEISYLTALYHTSYKLVTLSEEFLSYTTEFMFIYYKIYTNIYNIQNNKEEVNIFFTFKLFKLTRDFKFFFLTSRSTGFCNLWIKTVSTESNKSCPFMVTIGHMAMTFNHILN